VTISGHGLSACGNADRGFWIIASRWFRGWRDSLLLVKPETVLRWHRRGWRAYWSWRSLVEQTQGLPPTLAAAIAVVGWDAIEPVVPRKKLPRADHATASDGAAGMV
jgi:hypothetical protein